MIPTNRTLAPQPNAVKHSTSDVSVDVVRAYADIRRNLTLLAACVLKNLDAFKQLPPDDFFVQKTAKLSKTLRAFVEAYTEGPEESLHQAVPICAGPKHIVLPFAATVAGLLFHLGHVHVGIAVVDSGGRGVTFQYTSREDLVCREVGELRPVGGVS